MTERPSSLRRGAAYMLAASVAFALMGTAVKAVSEVLPIGEVVFWRSLASAVFLLPVVASRPADFRPREPFMHVVRASIGMVSMACYFTAIHRLPLGDAVLLTYLSPVLVATVSHRVLGETPPRAVWASLLLGIVGVALVVGPRAGPHGDLDPIGVLAAFGAAGMSAAAVVSIRVLTRTDRPLSIVFWFGAVGAALTSFSLLDGIGPAGASTWLLVAAMATCGTLAQWLMTRAYASADAARVSVFAYATPVLAYLCGFVALREVPPVTSLIGTVLVAAAGGLVARTPQDPGQA